MSELKAITNSVIENKLGFELKQIHISYYLIYRLILETGIPYNQLVTLKIQDLKDKNVISYTLRNGDIVNEPLSTSTMSQFSDYITSLENKDNDNTLLFTEMFNKCDHGIKYMNRLLSRCAKKIGLNKTINIQTIKKTYYFHLLQKTKKIALFKKRLGLSKDEDVLNYLGIEVYPQKINTWNKETFASTCTETELDSMEKNFDTLLASMKHIYQQEELPAIFYKESIQSLWALNNTINDYLNFLKEAGFL